MRIDPLRFRRRLAAGTVAVLTALSLLAAPGAQAAGRLVPPDWTSAAPRDGGARVGWSGPYGTPYDMTGMRTVVTASPGGATCTAVGGWNGDCDVLGLTNGVVYTFTVVRSNADGDSVPSAPTTSVVPGADSSAPWIEAATLSTARLPASGGDVVATIHVQDAGSGVRSAPTVWLRSGDSSTPTLTTTLVSGDARDGVYQATIPVPSGPPWGWGLIVDAVRDVAGNVSYSVAGDGLLVARSLPPTAITSAVRPGRVIRVGWTPPPADTGLPVLRYTVHGPDGWSVATVPGDATFADIEVGEEPAGVMRRFTVTAVNASGASDRSQESAPISVPAAEPSAPGRPWLRALPTSATVSWGPAAPHLAAISEYVVTAAPGGVVCRTTAQSCEISGLPPHVLTRLSVTATNAIGTGPSTDLGAVSFIEAPTVPGGLQVVSSGYTIRASWTSSEWGGDRGYYAVDTVPWTNGCTAAASGTFCDLRQMVPGVTYAIRVRAMNAAGSSAQSEPRTAVAFEPPAVLTPPAASKPPAPVVAPPRPVVKAPSVPARPRVAVRARVAKVAWAAPRTHGAPITRYLVQVQHGSKRVEHPVSAKARSFAVRKLRAGWRYRVRVVAVTKAGRSTSAFGPWFTAK